MVALAIHDFALVADTVYEHQWMQGGNEQWVYPAEFMASLSDEQKMYFNSFAFDPPFFGSTTDGKRLPKSSSPQADRSIAGSNMIT